MSYGYFCFANVLPLLTGYDKVSKEPPSSAAPQPAPNNTTTNSKKKKGKQLPLQPNASQPPTTEPPITIQNQSDPFLNDHFPPSSTNPITSGLLHLSALVNMSWISLQLFDPITAYNNSKTAITVAQNLSQSMGKQSHHPSMSVIRQHHIRYLFLAQVYHSEAAIHLGQYASAVNTLSGYLKSIDAADFGDPTTDDGPRPQGRMSNAKCSLYTNLAIVYIIKGEFSEAQKCISDVLSQNATFAPAILVQVYLYLVNNNIKGALERLVHPTFYPVTLAKAKTNKLM